MPSVHNGIKDMKTDKKYLGWYDMDEYVTYIASQIIDDDWKPRKICGVTRGGLVAGVMLSHQLNVPFEPIAPDTILFDSNNVLIVDDIYDTGKTITQLKRLNRHARFAVILFNEQMGDYAVDYYGQTYSGNEWIVFPWETDLS